MDVRRKGGGEGGVVKQLWTHVLIFACKRSNLADAGGGLGVNKNGQILQTFITDGPLNVYY